MTLTPSQERALLAALTRPDEVTAFDVEVLNRLAAKLAGAAIERQKAEAPKPPPEPDYRFN